jgi:hypothetical protein
MKSKRSSAMVSIGSRGVSLSRAPGAELGERVLEGEREPEERARQKKKKERAKKEKKKRALLSLPPGGSGRPSRADSRRRAGVFRVRAGAETIGSPRVGRERCCPYLHRSEVLRWRPCL